MLFRSTVDRREFLGVLAAASAAGMSLPASEARAAADAEATYDAPAFGNVSLLHFTDCHAQLLPHYFREPDTNIGAGEAFGKPPHLTGEALLKHFGIARGSRFAHAFTHLDFVQASRTYGKVGGFAHLATLVKRLRAQRPGALLLDGGDSWQGSATALWTRGQDMADAAKLLGVDIMTGHWEFTHGAARVQEIVHKDLTSKIEFLAQNIRTSDFDDPVFKAWTMREINGVPIAIELPPRVVLEIVETEPVVKGQTASSSFKPAVLSNGVRTMVPPHINVGTRVVVQTEDGAYLERAKD